MITGFRLAAILYLLYNAITFAYYAGKGEWTPNFHRRELIINSVIYGGLASLIVVSP